MLSSCNEPYGSLAWLIGHATYMTELPSAVRLLFGYMCEFCVLPSLKWMEASTSCAMQVSTWYQLQPYPREALRPAARMSKMRRSFRERGRMQVDQQNGVRGRKRMGGSGDKGGKVNAEK